MWERPEILELFGRQHGVADASQLQALGAHRNTIGRACQRGTVVKVLPGVVRLASSPDTFWARAMAVQLHTAPEGFLIGPTAAHVRGLRGMPVDRIHVTVWWRGRSALPTWVRRHGTSWRDESDVEILHGLRVERPLPMLLSLADVFNQFRFESAAADAWHRGLVTPQEVGAYLAQVRRRGRHGVSRMEAWLDKTGTSARPTQSQFERDVIEALIRVGLPDPIRQHPVTLRNGETVHLDIAWPDVLLAVEPGHSWWHGGDLQQRADQDRDRACSVVGWLVMRLDEYGKRNLTRVAREVGETYMLRRRQLGLAGDIHAP